MLCDLKNSLPWKIYLAYIYCAFKTCMHLKEKGNMFLLVVGYTTWHLAPWNKIIFKLEFSLFYWGHSYTFYCKQLQRQQTLEAPQILDHLKWIVLLKRCLNVLKKKVQSKSAIAKSSIACKIKQVCQSCEFAELGCLDMEQTLERD